jgi:hypothetical protein
MTILLCMQVVAYDKEAGTWRLEAVGQDSEETGCEASVWSGSLNFHQLLEAVSLFRQTKTLE